MGANKFIDDPTIKFNDDGGPGTLKFIDDTIKFSDDPTLKITDDPTLKFSDDPTLKVTDDPTIKAIDDPTLKAIDDPTLKAVDDPTFKSIDDPTLKAIDDPTIKFNDDGGGPTIKFIDDGGGGQTNKAIDDVKMPAYDKMFSDHKMAAFDQIDPGQIYTNPNPYASAQPFILANPHHSMAWQQTFGAAAGQPQPQAPNDPETRIAQYEAHLKQIAEGRAQLEKQIKDLDEYAKTITEQYNKEKEEIKNSKDKKK
jgi:hypothetical protein